MVFGFFCSQFSFTYSQNDTKFWRYVLFFSVQKWNSERFSHLPFLFSFRLIQILSIDFYVYMFVPSAEYCYIAPQSFSSLCHSSTLCPTDFVCLSSFVFYHISVTFTLEYVACSSNFVVVAGISFFPLPPLDICVINFCARIARSKIIIIGWVVRRATCARVYAMEHQMEHTTNRKQMKWRQHDDI